MIRRLSVVGMPKCSGQGNASAPLLLQPSLAAFGTRCCRSQSNLLQDYDHRRHHRHYHQHQQHQQQQPNFVGIGRRGISTSAARGSPNQWSVDSDTGVVSLNGTPKFQTVIGLEIHAQLDISTKLFSGCPVPHSQRNTGNTNNNNNAVTTAPRSALLQKPNSSVWPMDVGVPGVLPRLSAEAVRAAVLSAGALGCELPPVSRFERKHYFYADLPLGYQITQQRWPLARDGLLVCRERDSPNRAKTKKKKKKKHKKKAKAKQSAGGGRGEGSNNNTNDDDDDDDSVFALRIERVQLEQDTGKTLADAHTNPLTHQKESLVDFNRAGRALIEVVSHPDLRSSTQASVAVETLRSLLRHIGTCDGKMEEGSLRCDLNVSIAPLAPFDDGDGDGDNRSSSSDEDVLSRTGHRVEVKNLNSVRQVQQAAEYEALRQARALLEEDAPTLQETRTFCVKSNRTVVLRTKEGARDYRFLPEPDLPPLVLSDALGGTTESSGSSNSVEAFLEANLPELPETARRRLQTDHGLSDYLASVITNDPPSIALFDEAVREAKTQLTPLGLGPRVERNIPQTVANLLCNELFGLVRELELKRLIEEGLLLGDSSVRFSRVNGQQLGEIVALVLEGSISNTMAKQLLRVLYNDAMEEKDDHGDDHGDGDDNNDNGDASSSKPSPLPPPSPRRVARERGFELVTDAGQLEALCRGVIEDRPEELERYKLGGKYATKITKFLVGTAMAASRGNAHPERLAEILAEVLEEVAPLGNPNANGNGNGNGNSER